MARRKTRTLILYRIDKMVDDCVVAKWRLRDIVEMLEEVREDAWVSYDEQMQMIDGVLDVIENYEKSLAILRGVF